MGLLGSLFSAAADIAKETITETMNQNETEKFIKIMMERDAQNAEANEKLYQDWLTHERSNYFAAKKNTIIHDAFDVLMDSFEDTGKFDFSAMFTIAPSAGADMEHVTCCSGVGSLLSSPQAISPKTANKKNPNFFINVFIFSE